MTQEEKKEFVDFRAVVQAALGLALDEIDKGLDSEGYSMLLRSTTEVIVEIVKKKKEEWEEEAYKQGYDAGFDSLL